MKSPNVKEKTISPAVLSSVSETPVRAVSLRNVPSADVPNTLASLGQSAHYGATEIKAYIRHSTMRGFTVSVLAAGMLLGGYSLATSLNNANATKAVAVNKMKLSQLPPPPSNAETPPPPPPPTTIAGPAARAGVPVPVPDALVTPDMKDFANVEEVSRASAVGGDGNDQGFLGLSKDVETEVREEEPDAYEFMAVEKEPYADLADIQSKIVYPEIARRAGIEGKVSIRVLVGKNGKPKKVLIESTDSELLNNAATTAVMKTTFTPAILANQPIDCWVSIPIVFRMK